LLYKEQFKETIWEWTLLDWMKNLKEAEIETIGEVRSLLNDKKLRKNLDKIAIKIRDFPLENSEWVVYSALVASELSLTSGIKRAKKLIQDAWDEIVATARNDILSEMPETLDEFIEMVESGYLPFGALKELGGIQSCQICGSDILIPEDAAYAILEYYESLDKDIIDIIELESLLSDYPEAEDTDYPGFCQWCGHQMAKDD